MIAFRPSRAGEPPGSVLLQAMLDELEGHYGPIDGPGTPSATATDMAAPHGAFLVGFDGDDPVACGGLKRLAAGLAEIKRMYVAPRARSRGVARALLTALEDAARELGYDRVRLDTGPLQPHARRLYLATGYEEIPDYNANPHASFWGEKRLSPAGDGRRPSAEGLR